MASPDIVLGPGDTAPITRITLYEPDAPDGTPGAPLNLQNGYAPGSSYKTVVCKHQVRDWSLAPVVRAVIIRQTAPPSAAGLSDGVLQGVIDIDWLATGGPVVPAPSDHNLRFIVTDSGGHQETFPNGADCPRPDGSNPAFLWLQVGRDFLPTSFNPSPPLQQTPGSVLIYDAAGNAAVLADVAAGQVLKSGGVGLPPSYAALTSGDLSDSTAAGRAMFSALNPTAQTALLDLATVTTRGLMPAVDKHKLAYLGDFVDFATMSGVTSWTSADWNAEAYREILVLVRGTGGMTAGSPATIRFNGDATANNYWSTSTFAQGGTTISWNAPGTAGSDTKGQLALTGSAPAVDIHLDVMVNPLVVAGCSRHYTCEFVSQGTTNSLSIMGNSNGFWKDTNNGMTFLSLQFGSAFSGYVKVLGIPA
jgi:hypothetical protein